MSIDFKGMRVQYKDAPLTIESIGTDPFVAFNLWFKIALEEKVKEPNAMTIATIDENGFPDARVVLLKELIEEKFVFYTNYASNKGKQIEANPYVCLVFNWLDLERKIRIKGKVEKYDLQKSEQYFRSRPRESQIAAWSSPQSKIISDRSVLDTLVSETTKLFADSESLPIPPTWGGYSVDPFEIEFWQGRSNRLHDRIKFIKTESSWKIDRLAP
jgi:pyridoxamine 5'-phosphate oxidase